MKVLCIQKSTGRGGAKNSLLETLTAMRRGEDLHPHVIAGTNGQFTERCAEIGVPFSVVRLPEWRKFFERLVFSRKMRGIARKHAGTGIDWVISNEMWWAPHAVQIAKLLGCRSAVMVRDGIATVRKSRQYRLDQCHLVLPVSSTIAHSLQSHSALANRVHILFNSVSVSPAKPEDASQLAGILAPFTDVGRWLLVVGKIGSRKKQADAVRVARALIDRGHRDLGLLLAGDIDPDYLSTMAAAISECGLNDRVAMIGNFNGLAALLDLAHTVLLTSLREGLPRSLVEAISAGKPAFSYPCEGVEDIYGTHISRFVSGSSDPGELAQILHIAWSNPSETSLAFAEVKQSVMERFSPHAHLNRLRSLINGTIQKQTQ
jgi:glycosyltransferase involved in cell wall biosynthesis